MNKLDEKIQKNRVTRLLTSHTALAFCYGIFLLLYELKFLREIVPAVHPFLIAWAVALALYDVVVRKLWKHLPLWQPLAGFAILAGITAVVNRQVGLGENLKVWVLACLPLVAFLPLCLLCKREEREKAVLRALLGAVAVVCLASFVAIIMYLLRMELQLEMFGITHMVGFRYYIVDDPASGVLLYGFYTDTNHAAAYAVIGMVYSMWVLYAYRHKVVGMGMKVFAIVNLVVQACYFPLANSRGGWLSLAVAAAVCVFLYCYCTRFWEKKALKRVALSAWAAILAVAVLCGGLVLLRSGLSVVSKTLNISVSVGGASELPEDEQVSWGEQGADTFEKTDDGFGAGRLLIWQEALTLYKENPILGIGPGNSTHYAKQYAIGELLPYGSALHNSFLDLLVDYGILGFAALMGFFAYCVWLVLGCFFKAGKHLDGTTHLAAFSVVFLAGVSVFLSCTFINTTAMYFLMLCVLSYLLAQCKDVKA